MTHPEQAKLEVYCEGGLSDAEHFQVKAHIDGCKECKQFVEDYRKKLSDRFIQVKYGMSDGRNILAEYIREASERGGLFKLIRIDGSVDEAARLAADSAPKGRGQYCAATMVCQDPEIMLKLMVGDPDRPSYLQVISDVERLMSGVLVEAPDIGFSAMTSEYGVAPFRDLDIDKASQCEWQVRAADAIFKFDPASSTESQPQTEEIVIKSYLGNVIGVSVVERGAESEFVIRIIAIGNQPPDNEMVVAVIQEDRPPLQSLTSQRSARFKLTAELPQLTIKLFK